MITIFTPTYNNRASLWRLYQSLLMQTTHKFEWLIVDDGSKDGSMGIVERFQDRTYQFPLRYFYQRHSGEHRAINRGVAEAKGVLFMIVRPGDYLPPFAIQTLAEKYSQVARNPLYGGVGGYKCTSTGKRIGQRWKLDSFDSSPMEMRKHGNVAVPEPAEVFRTEVLREFPFPEFPGEEYCPPALLWHRIGEKYRMRYFNDYVYTSCSGPASGPTAEFKMLRQSPLTSMTYFSELYHGKNFTCRKLKYAIDFWRFTPPRLLREVSRFQMLSLGALTGLIPGAALRLGDSLKSKWSPGGTTPVAQQPYPCNITPVHLSEK